MTDTTEEQLQAWKEQSCRHVWWIWKDICHASRDFEAPHYRSLEGAAELYGEKTIPFSGGTAFTKNDVLVRILLHKPEASMSEIAETGKVVFSTYGLEYVEGQEIVSVDSQGNTTSIKVGETAMDNAGMFLAEKLFGFHPHEIKCISPTLPGPEKPVKKEEGLGAIYRNLTGLMREYPDLREKLDAAHAILPYSIAPKLHATMQQVLEQEEIASGILYRCEKIAKGAVR